MTKHEHVNIDDISDLKRKKFDELNILIFDVITEHIVI